MTLHVYDDLEQGSEEWLAARAGIVTASTIGKLLTPTLKVANNDTARGLLLTLAAERITGNVEDTFVTFDMQRGTDDEPYARDAYAEWAGVRVEEVGFTVREEHGIRVGYSPDGLVGHDGLLECKSRRQARQLATILDGGVPSVNMAQLQTGLWVTGRDWVDYVSYRDGMHLYVNRVNPDPAWFDAIEAAAIHAEHTIHDYIRAYEARVDGLPRTEKRPDLDDIVI